MLGTYCGSRGAAADVLQHRQQESERHRKRQKTEEPFTRRSGCKTWEEVGRRPIDLMAMLAARPAGRDADARQRERNPGSSPPQAHQQTMLEAHPEDAEQGHPAPEVSDPPAAAGSMQGQAGLETSPSALEPGTGPAPCSLEHAHAPQPTSQATEGPAEPQGQAAHAQDQGGHSRQTAPGIQPAETGSEHRASINPSTNGGDSICEGAEDRGLDEREGPQIQMRGAEHAAAIPDGSLPVAGQQEPPAASTTEAEPGMSGPTALETGAQAEQPQSGVARAQGGEGIAAVKEPETRVEAGTGFSTVDVAVSPFECQVIKLIRAQQAYVKLLQEAGVFDIGASRSQQRAHIQSEQSRDTTRQALENQQQQQQQQQQQKTLPEQQEVIQQMLDSLQTYEKRARNKALHLAIEKYVKDLVRHVDMVVSIGSNRDTLSSRRQIQQLQKHIDRLSSLIDKLIKTLVDLSMQGRQRTQTASQSFSPADGYSLFIQNAINVLMSKGVQPLGKCAQGLQTQIQALQQAATGARPPLQPSPQTSDPAQQQLAAQRLAQQHTGSHAVPNTHLHQARRGQPQLQQVVNLNAEDILPAQDPVEAQAPMSRSQGLKPQPPARHHSSLSAMPPRPQLAEQQQPSGVLQSGGSLYRSSSAPQRQVAGMQSQSPVLVQQQVSGYSQQPQPQQQNPVPHQQQFAAAQQPHFAVSQNPQYPLQQQPVSTFGNPGTQPFPYAPPQHGQHHQVVQQQAYPIAGTNQTMQQQQHLPQQMWVQRQSPTLYPTAPGVHGQQRQQHCPASQEGMSMGQPMIVQQQQHSQPQQQPQQQQQNLGSHLGMSGSHSMVLQPQQNRVIQEQTSYSMVQQQAVINHPAPSSTQPQQCHLVPRAFASNSSPAVPTAHSQHSQGLAVHPGQQHQGQEAISMEAASLQQPVQKLQVPSQAIGAPAAPTQLQPATEYATATADPARHQPATTASRVPNGNNTANAHGAHNEQIGVLINQMHKIVEMAMEKDPAFIHPVTEDIAPGYLTIISQPICLLDISNKLKNGRYVQDNVTAPKLFEAFHDDLVLMVNNCLKYNPKGNVFHDKGEKMWEFLKGMLQVVKCGALASTN